MNALKEQLNGQLEVLAVPCNQFGLQEPAKNEELLNGLKYVRPGNGYEPNFIVTAKTDVNGNDAHPMFTLLKGSCPPVKDEIGDAENFYWKPIRNSDLTWNFNKFLIRPDGTPFKRYDSEVEPPGILADILSVLAPGVQDLEQENTISVEARFKQLYNDFENTIKAFNSK